jgi:hypothetical protein
MKAWCCSWENVGCASFTTTETVTYDCSTGFTNWGGAWSPRAKEWCCLQQGVGCPESPKSSTPQAVLRYDAADEQSPKFNCSAGLLNWQHEWSEDKKEWCCKTTHGGAGCPLRTGAGGAAAPIRLLPQASPGDSFGDSEAIDKTLQEARLLERAAMVTTSSPKYECEGSWQQDWSEDQKAWCCEHTGWGCHSEPSTTPQVNCSVAVATWQTEWSNWKKQWCCDHERVGCPVEDDFVSKAQVELTLLDDGRRALRQGGASARAAPLAAAFAAAAAAACAVVLIRRLRAATTLQGSSQALPFTRLAPNGCLE